MSYQEKKTLLSIITGVFIFGSYFFYTLNKVQEGMVSENDFKFWAVTMLFFIGIGIVAAIIIQILFHILLSIGMAVREQIEKGSVEDQSLKSSIATEMITDERDQLIELKSMRIGFVASSIGFIIGLISLALNYSPVVMMNILFFSFGIGSLLDGCIQLYLYRRG